METVKEGWVQMPNAKKAHYIRQAKALCGRWMFLGKIYAEDQTSTNKLPNDCVSCWNKVEPQNEGKQQ